MNKNVCSKLTYLLGSVKNTKKPSRNFKWRIQYSHEKFKKSLNYAQNWYMRVFEVDDPDFAIRLLKNLSSFEAIKWIVLTIFLRYLCLFIIS